MENTDNHRDPLPEEFSSEEEAGEFWDTHSLTDYEEFLEPVELDVDLTGRHFQIEIDRETFLALRTSAKKYCKPMKQLASDILWKSLKAA